LVGAHGKALFTQNVQIMDFKEPVASDTTPPSQSSASTTPAEFAATQFGVTQTGARHPASLAFDVCHVGVVLRVVLGVQAVMGLALAFQAQGGMEAINRWAQSAVVTLPASLLWLVVTCASRRLLARLGDAGQWGFTVGLGAVVGVLAQLQSAWLDAVLEGSRLAWGWPQVPAMFTGAAIAFVGVWWLRQRARSVLPAMATARLAELQARIRPHFLFNTLNTAIALVQIDPQRAEAVLEDLAELFRQALVSPSVRTTLGEEIDLARRYLSIEQLRFGERIQVRWELEEGGNVAEVPALVLQPLVENAVRHGIEVDPQGGWIVVRTKVQSGSVVLTVSNSVPGQPLAHASAGHGMALRNVRQRLSLMHDVQADFEAGLHRSTDGRQPPVYVVKVVVPLPRGEQA
jgi:two-component system sensor histidine kinase AlgZ